MPSHLKNYMKEQRDIVKARNKAMENYIKLSQPSTLVNYELPKEEKDVKEFNLSELSNACRSTKT